jgi:hypothetical protein
MTLAELLATKAHVEQALRWLTITIAALHDTQAHETLLYLSLQEALTEASYTLTELLTLQNKDRHKTPEILEESTRPPK